MELNIYTDGSHKKGTHELGIGTFFIFNNTSYMFSFKYDKNLLNAYATTENVSNPATETLGRIEAFNLKKSLLTF